MTDADSSSNTKKILLVRQHLSCVVEVLQVEVQLRCSCCSVAASEAVEVADCRVQLLHPLLMDSVAALEDS